MGTKSTTRRTASSLRRHATRATGGGARTTVRVPPEVEIELGLIEGDGATRGAALQELLREGAQARARRRADAEAASRLRAAFLVEPSHVPGFPDDADVEALMFETRTE